MTAKKSNFTYMKWEAKIITHKGSKRIAVYFEKKYRVDCSYKKVRRLSMESNFGDLASSGHGGKPDSV